MNLPLQVRLFFCAVQFLTRIPTPQFPGFEPDWISRAARYFPLVGLGVGLLSATVFLAARRVFPPLLASTLTLAFGLLVTGAFHEDGFVDAVDGLGGGQDPESRLEIMKDSRIGTFGGFALAASLLLKATALAALSPRLGACGLVIAHGLGRGLSVAAMKATPYVGDRSASKWKPVPAGPTAAETAFAVLTGLTPLLLATPQQAAAAFGLAAALSLLMGLTARRLIGGHTGDVLGAVEQAGEIGVLLGLAARF